MTEEGQVRGPHATEEGIRRYCARADGGVGLSHMPHNCLLASVHVNDDIA